MICWGIMGILTSSDLETVTRESTMRRRSLRVLRRNSRVHTAANIHRYTIIKDIVAVLLVKL